MLYVGLDIHSKNLAICVLDENGKPMRRCQVRTIDEMIRVLGQLPDRFEVCYEASCGYGFYHDLLRPIAAPIDAERVKQRPIGRSFRRVPSLPCPPMLSDAW